MEFLKPIKFVTSSTLLKKRKNAPESLYEKQQQCSNSGTTASTSSQARNLCSICNIDIEGMTDIQHITGITHQLCKNRLLTNQTPDIFGFTPNDNKGFQILRKQGYIVGLGLGKDSDGRVNPVSARMKTDRLGIGAKHSALKPKSLEISRDKVKDDQIADRRKRTAILAYLKA